MKKKNRIAAQRCHADSIPGRLRRKVRFYIGPGR